MLRRTILLLTIFLADPLAGLADETLSIKTVLDNPTSYQLQSVTLQGVVKDVSDTVPVFNSRFNTRVGYGYTFTLDDGTGSISVVAGCPYCPTPDLVESVAPNEKVLVVGTLQYLQEGGLPPRVQISAAGVRRLGGEMHTLTILHSSEHHGQVLPIERRGEKRIAGMAGRAALIAAIRKEREAVLLVDSGDILIGTPLSSFFRGEPDIKAMNLMGYQAMAAGNHEFDFGLDHFRSLRELSQFPILCSNVSSRVGDLPCLPWTVVHTGPLSIGVISLMGHRNFPDTFNREVVKLLEFRHPIETARALARTLKDTRGVDLVVAVTHEETDEDMALLAQVPEVDVIIGGHTEGFDGLRTADAATPVEELTSPGSVFVKTHRLGRTLGRLDLELAKQPGTSGAWIVKARAQNLPVNEDVPPDPAVNDLIQTYARKLEGETATIIGQSLVVLDGDNNRVRSQETNLGNLLADLLRAEFGTDVALLNGGQIRDSIPAGPVDIKRVRQVLPFDSPTVTITITGDQLRLALENSVSRLPGMTAGRFLQVSGLTVTYDLSAQPGSRAREISIGGRPLEAGRRYSVATDSFLADGGDGYTIFTSATDRVERQMPMRDLLLAALRAKPLKASVEGRIQFVESGSGASGPAEHHQPSTGPMPGG